MDHVILQLARTQAITKTGFFKEVGRVAHTLHATGHNHIRIAQLNGLGCQHDRFKRRSADLVNADTFHFPGHAGLNGRLLGRILAIATGQDLPHNHFVNFALFNAGALYRRFDHDGAQISGTKGGQRSVEAS